MTLYVSLPANLAPARVMVVILIIGFVALAFLLRFLITVLINQVSETYGETNPLEISRLVFTDPFVKGWVAFPTTKQC